MSQFRPTFQNSLHARSRQEKTNSFYKLGFKKMDIPLSKTNSASSLSLRINSSIFTLPLFRNEAFLKLKYHVEKTSARRIAVITGCIHSPINDALENFGLTKQKRQGGWVPYGTKLLKTGKASPVRQQKVINWLLKKKNSGWSNAKIAASLSERKIMSPGGKGSWYPAPVAKIIKQNESKSKRPRSAWVSPSEPVFRCESTFLSRGYS